MNWFVNIYAILLFFFLTPGVLVRLPPKGSTLVVAIIHAIIFGIIFHFTHKIVWKASVGINTNIPVPSHNSTSTM